MFAQVTVTQVAAPLAVVSALFALVFLLYGIPRAARNVARSKQGSVGISVLLCLGNVGFVVAFLYFVAQSFSSGIDPLLAASPCPLGTAAVACVQRNVFLTLSMMQLAVIVALVLYALSLAVLAIEMSAGRSRRQRRSASSE